MINTMEWLILGAICLFVLICICLIVFFCRRNRNDHIVISTEPKFENEAEAPVVDVNKNKFKFYDDMMNRLDTLNKKADIAIENDKKTLEDMEKINYNLKLCYNNNKKATIYLYSRSRQKKFSTNTFYINSNFKFIFFCML